MVATLTLLAGIVSIIFGILVLAIPKFLRFVVGLYFLLIGAYILLTAL